MSEEFLGDAVGPVVPAGRVAVLLGHYPQPLPRADHLAKRGERPVGAGLEVARKLGPGRACGKPALMAAAGAASSTTITSTSRG